MRWWRVILLIFKIINSPNTTVERNRPIKQMCTMNVRQYTVQSVDINTAEMTNT